MCVCQIRAGLQYLCVGSVLRSTVLGICLTLLSKSLRWIYSGCQVPVVTDTQYFEKLGWNRESRRSSSSMLKNTLMSTKEQSETAAAIQHFCVLCGMLERACAVICFAIMFGSIP